VKSGQCYNGIMQSANALRDHLAYTAWANRRLLDAAAQLTPEQLTRDFQTADKSVLGTLVHVFAGDRIWLARVEGRPPGPFIAEGEHDLPVLQAKWPPVLDQWQRWASSLTEETAAAELSYTDLRGKPWRQPIWQIVLHVVNHGTHHRGQAAGFLRSMSVAPPALDLTVFYRTRAATA
jgi:uncharacterized damage-inducible protein DinB